VRAATTRRRLGALGLALMLGAGLAGCGGEGDTVAEASPSCSADGQGASTTADLTTKPTITVSPCQPPTTLQVQDVVEGEGEAVRAGDVVNVKYVGVTYADGKQFDASWDRGDDFSFPIGASQVIPGWDQGLLGMKVGGRRLLVIPPDLGYGAQGAGSDIPPGATLVFVVDLVSIGPPAS